MHFTRCVENVNPNGQFLRFIFRSLRSVPYSVSSCFAAFHIQFRVSTKRNNLNDLKRIFNRRRSRRLCRRFHNCTPNRNDIRSANVHGFLQRELDETK